MKKVVKIILVNSEKKLLFYLRDNKKSIPYAGYWGLIGGGIKKGETLLQALKREINEEIPDCEIKDIKDFGKFFYRRLDTQVFIFKGKIDKPIDYVNSKLSEGQLVRYFDISDLENLRLPKPIKNFVYQNKKDIF